MHLRKKKKKNAGHLETREAKAEKYKQVCLFFKLQTRCTTASEHGRYCSMPLVCLLLVCNLYSAQGLEGHESNFKNNS